MNDKEIIALYWARSENAIELTSEKYGKYCRTIAYAILGNHEDSEECVNDAYIKVWNTIPPQNPHNLASYIARITRNISLDRYRSNSAEKRGGGHAAIVVNELESIVPSFNDGREIENDVALVESLNCFLDSMSPKKRKIFMLRYWYFATIKEIAKEHHMSEGTVKMILMRARRELKKHLLKEGVI